MRPTPHAHALNAIVRDLMNTCDGATYIAQEGCGASHVIVYRTAGLSQGRSLPLAFPSK